MIIMMSVSSHTHTTRMWLIMRLDFRPPTGIPHFSSPIILWLVTDREERRGNETQFSLTNCCWRWGDGWGEAKLIPSIVVDVVVVIVQKSINNILNSERAHTITLDQLWMSSSASWLEHYEPMKHRCNGGERRLESSSSKKNFSVPIFSDSLSLCWWWWFAGSLWWSQLQTWLTHWCPLAWARPCASSIYVCDATVK